MLYSRRRVSSHILIHQQGKEGKGPRYAVYDFNYDLASGEGARYALTAREDLE